MKKISLLILIMVIIVGCTSSNQEKPNVIVILANGLGYEDIGVYRSDSITRTPNLDKLAQKGICFTNGYTPSSNPTFCEYALMTGVYPSKSIYSDQQSDSISLTINEKQFTLSKALKNVGYVTANIGKWHLGNSCIQKAGFDFSYLSEGRTDTDKCVSEVKNFISEHKDTPYFLYVGTDNDSIRETDCYVGELMSHLEKENLLERTLIVFSGDDEVSGTDTISGHGDIRIPLFLYWKGKISPFVSDAMVCQIDLVASLGKLIDIDMPKGLDSREYLDAFIGKTINARKNINHIQ